ncbi:MAG: acyl carrier protein phosphodiesterase [Flavobacteriales bacterium]|nr:acyl carrier protein phosphodiesterase [Flavobacteriales bacterium]
MNYLAHLFLSGNDNELLVGNFIGDAVKGKAFSNYSRRIAMGIKMHRAIDSFTDNHKVVLKGKERLYPRHHKFSGILVDLFYDYFLCKNWLKYSEEPLEMFIRNKYQILEQNIESMPPLSQLIFHKMVEDNWLSSYQNVIGISKALNGLSKRTKFQNNMKNASSDLLLHENLYDAEFNCFFPQIVDFCNSYKIRHGQT